jgi:hypothetical protein
MIVSFDPALLNLAWSKCKLNEKKEIDVIDYGLINLIGDKKKCCKCSKKSCYFSFDNIELVFCCSAHKKEFIKPQKIKEKTLDELCKILIDELDKIFTNDFLNDVECILIENQPSFLNVKCKNISIMLLMYFKMKNKKIIFRNPNQKVFNNKFEKRNIYAQTKKFSIQLCHKLIDSKIMDAIKEKYNKIDDITDSIMMTISYLYDGIPPDKIKDLIKK